MTTPAHAAGVVAGMEKVAYGYVPTGQYTSSHRQPPPPQTPEGHKRRTAAKATALAAGLTAGVIAVKNRKGIAKGVGNIASKMKGTGKAKGITQKLLGASEKESIDKIKGAKSWGEIGMDSKKPSGRDGGGLGRAPVAGTPVGDHVKKEFAGMGMSPPPMNAPSAPQAKRKGGKALAAGGALAAGTGAVMTAGVARGAAKGLNRRVSQKEDDYTPGMSGARR
jgi:hypothetical protein